MARRKSTVDRKTRLAENAKRFYNKMKHDPLFMARRRSISIASYHRIKANKKAEKDEQ